MESKEVTWLDDAHDWLVVPVANARVRTGIRKMLSVAPRLTLEDVAGGLARQRSDVGLPHAIPRSLCATVCWLKLDPGLGRRVLCHRARPGPGRRGMKRATVGVYLSRSPIFKPVSRGRYALRGAIVPSPVLA